MALNIQQNILNDLDAYSVRGRLIIPINLSNLQKLMYLVECKFTYGKSHSNIFTQSKFQFNEEARDKGECWSIKLTEIY